MSPPPDPTVTRPMIVGALGEARLTAARSQCEGFPGTSSIANAVCPDSATPPTVLPVKSPIARGALGLLRSRTFIPKVPPDATASEPDTATSWLSNPSLTLDSIAGAVGDVTFHPYRPP